MTTFAISSKGKSPELDQKLKEVYGEDNFHQVDENLRIIISQNDVSAQDVYNRIFSEGNSFGNFVIFSVTSYFGYHSKSTWEWLKLKGA